MCRAAIFGGMGEKGVPGEAPDAEGVGCRNEVAAEAVPRLGLRPCLLLLSKLCGVQEVGNRVGCSRQTSIETEGLISESDLCLLHSVLCAGGGGTGRSPRRRRRRLPQRSCGRSRAKHGLGFAYAFCSYQSRVVCSRLGAGLGAKSIPGQS